MLMMMFMLMFDGADNFRKGEMTWREQREESMREPDSWFTVVGFHWLEEGENTFGTLDSNSIVLPKHTTVERAGSFTLENGKIHYQMSRGQRALLEDKPVNSGDIKPGQILAHNHLRMFIIERGGRMALRVRYLRHPQYMEFESLNFYRPKGKYLVDATFEPFEEPRTIKIATVIDTELELIVPGKIKFKLKGKELELLPTLSSMEDEEFFIMLKDKTSADETYGGGRFLYASRPVDGKMKLNFNRAINPPCEYTPYATCPLPPSENWLDIAIEAGEKKYKEDHYDEEDDED